MDERLSVPSGYNDRPSQEAMLPITEEQQRDFIKKVEFWSSEPDSAEAYESKTAGYMTELAPHRAVTRVVKTRSRSMNGVQYSRGGVTVLCRSADDFASLRVDRRAPTDDPNVDLVTRTEYVIDGPDGEVIELTWLVNRETGERIKQRTKEELIDELRPMLTFGKVLGEDVAADLVLPAEPDEDVAFTQGRFWEAEDISTELAEAGWERSLPE